MKKYLIVFGTDNYQNSINSLLKSSESFFDEFIIYKPKDIDEKFFNKNKNILTQTRGAGYWLWKPYFIQKTLNNINNGDIVFYVDAGNIFKYDPSFLYESFKINDGIILFDNRDGMLCGNAAKNYISCKKDSFVLMDCDEDKYINGIHLNASYQIYLKNNNSLQFISEYLNYCQNINIITDTPNQYGENYPGYYDHRHDQSILSLLAIKKNITPLVDPSEWGNNVINRSFEQLFIHHRSPNYIL
jgi:hypothetical protein